MFGVLPQIWCAITCMVCYHIYGALPHMQCAIITYVGGYYSCGVLSQMWRAITCMVCYDTCSVLLHVWGAITYMVYYHICGVLSVITSVCLVFMLTGPTDENCLLSV